MAPVTESPRYSAVKVAIDLLQRWLTLGPNDKKMAALRSESQRFITAHTDPVTYRRLVALRSKIYRGTASIAEMIEHLEPKELQRIIETDTHMGPLVETYLRIVKPKPAVPPARRRTPASTSAGA